MKITVYTKPGCHLCEDALDLLDRMSRHYRLDVEQVNILDDMALYEAYKEKIPVIQAGDGSLGRLEVPVTEPELRAYLEMARRAETGTPSSPGAPSTRNAAGKSVLPPGVKEPLIDRVAGWIGKHWLRLVCIALGIFVGLPWLAPVFAALNLWSLADPIYTMYAFTCHQLPERAGDLFGYQVAFCYRNTALYGGVFLFGMLYGVSRDRGVSWLGFLRRPIAWWLLLLFLLPMGVDGITHMIGLRDPMLDGPMDMSFGSFYIGSQTFSLNWWLRITTGLLAALGTVWFAFPRMQGAVDESEAMRLVYMQSAMARRRAVEAYGD